MLMHDDFSECFLLFDLGTLISSPDTKPFSSLLLIHLTTKGPRRGPWRSLWKYPEVGLREFPLKTSGSSSSVRSGMEPAWGSSFKSGRIQNVPGLP